MAVEARPNSASLSNSTLQDALDDGDVSFLALLAEETPAATLPSRDIFGDSVLIDAWKAAVSEFRAFGTARTKKVDFVPLDREAQLMASPLYYAPPPPPTLQNIRPAKRQRIDPEAASTSERAALNSEEMEYADYEGEGELYDEEEGEELNGETEAGEEQAQANGDEPEEGEPYYDPLEWQPVLPKSATSNGQVPSQSSSFPIPPPEEAAIPQDPSLLEKQTEQEALQKALNAWYSAGYAAALYHVRSGLVKL